VNSSLRNVFNAVVEAARLLQPAQATAFVPAVGNTGSGTVAYDSSTLAAGHFQPVLQVILGGAPGTATAQLSLDGGDSFDATFTIPAGLYAVPLPVTSPGSSSLVPSGLVLSFGGSFSAGDSFSSLVVPTVTYLYGADEVSSQDTVFPRAIVEPVGSEFAGTEDYAKDRDQRNQPRAILNDVAHFDVHCWGCDWDRAEYLRDVMIGAFHVATQAVKRVTRSEWIKPSSITQAGRLIIFHASVKKPVQLLQAVPDLVPVQPPFTGVPTQEFDNLDGSSETSTK
jgi:hypothetical protein